jgi:molybdopterin-guanine dinucleotide biosynthesis protein A
MSRGSAVSAAILAGGRATRFGGRDKGALVVGGRSIVERQIGELSQVADDLLIVGGDPSVALRYGVRYAPDRIAGCGPLGGVHAALSEAKHAVTLVLACDMPYVAAPLLHHLLSVMRDADLVVPRTERGYHPLCAAYARTCLEPITRRLTSGRLKLTDLFDDLRVTVVSAETVAAFGDPGRLLANVNTPDQYLSIEANKP